MKTLKTLSFIVLSFVATSLFGQTSEIIDPSNVSGEKVSQIFQNAYMTVNKDLSNDKTVVVEDILKIYLDIDNNKKYITYSVTFGFQPGVSDLKKLELINLLNSEVLMIAPRYSKTADNIWVKYDYWIEGGVTPKSIVLCEKQFVAALQLMLKKDVEKIVK